MSTKPPLCGIIKLFPAGESLVRWHPGKERKIVNLFLHIQVSQVRILASHLDPRLWQMPNFSTNWDPTDYSVVLCIYSTLCKGEHWSASLHPIVTSHPFSESLKVVGNKKWGVSGRWLLLEDGFGPWRSLSVYFLMWPSYFLYVFPFPVYKAIGVKIGEAYQTQSS